MRYPFVAMLVIAFGLGPAQGGEGVKIVDDGLHLSSLYFDLRLSHEQPTVMAIGLDGLGQGRIGSNSLRPPAKSDVVYQIARGQEDGKVWVEYRRQAAVVGRAPGWRFEIGDRELRLVSQWSEGEQPPPLLLNFDPERSHVTLLGRMNGIGSVRLPALLHVPNQGSVRITGGTSEKPLSLGYDAHRGDPDEANFVKMTFPAATAAQPRVEYRCEVTCVYPLLEKIDKDPRYNGFHRNWLDIIQLNPRFGLLANNSTSDAAMICLYEYSDIAMHTPPLAEGLTALHLVRDTLDRYLAGTPGFGLPGYYWPDDPSPKPTKNPPFLDCYPALLIAAADYVEAAGDKAWLEKNYAGVKKWADAMLAMDHDGNGLIEYPRSGNWNSMHNAEYACNWWDCINFGHEDAWSNALAYRALKQLAALVEPLDKAEAARYQAAAGKLQAAYFKTFYNPVTGIVAGWRSADGELHDYWFPWISGAAIHYGLVPKDKANGIMDRLMAKIKEVGFDRFDLGLPGNLVPVPKRDYVAPKTWRFGGGDKDDGSQGFQHYENGGATACFAYFTLAALYDLGRHEEADRMLLPVLGGFDRNDFEGRDFIGRSKDWKSWDGAPFGYEGYLGDNYYALLALVARDRALRGLKMEQ